MRIRTERGLVNAEHLRRVGIGESDSRPAVDVVAYFDDDSRFPLATFPKDVDAVQRADACLVAISSGLSTSGVICVTSKPS